MAEHNLIGNYQHTIDAKGRLFRPAKQREILGSRVYMTRGLDDCIFVFSESGWNSFIDGLSQLSLAKSRLAARYFSGNAAVAEIDGQGRIGIPQNLRKLVGLNKDVTVVGVLDRVELWDTAKWDSFNGDVSNDAVSEVLEELGF